MKKIILGAIALISSALVLTGCNEDKRTKIGVIQLVEHPALDANYKGFVDGLA